MAFNRFFEDVNNRKALRGATCFGFGIMIGSVALPRLTTAASAFKDHPPAYVEAIVTFAISFAAYFLFFKAFFFLRVKRAQRKQK